MKLVKKADNHFTFHLGKRERFLFVEVLRSFPLTPVAHHRISKAHSDDPGCERQQLLEEFMAGQKAEQRQRVADFLADGSRFEAYESAWRLRVSGDELEWLLQVFNDVRVGSWLMLGSPDPLESLPKQVIESNARFLVLLELSGHFECALLDAMEAGDSPS